MEIVLFYVAATVSIVATALVVTRLDASHALIYLIFASTPTANTISDFCNVFIARSFK